jgi:purine-binding chemotaxis protein CheW
MTGILVDAVSDIITLAGADIQAPPEIMRESQDSYVDGIAVLDGRMVTLLEMGELTAVVPSDIEAAAA